MRAIIPILIIVFFCPMSRGQDNDAALKLRLAQAYEQSGEWARAVAIFEELYQTEPNNFVYFDGLRQGYTQLREYEKAIGLVERELGRQPANVGLLASLGGLYYESGSEHKADSLWNRVIAIDPKNIGLYRVVASQMMEHRLFEQAVNVYRSGRKTTGNDNAFSDELANLYLVLQQYSAASVELTKILKASPQQLPLVQSKIGSFTIRNEGLLAAANVTKEEVQKDPDNVALRKLSAWLAMEGKDYQTALDEYRIIDHLGKSNGLELLSFAHRAYQDKAFRIAAQAYKDITEVSNAPAIVPQARFGYARSMEDLAPEADSSIAVSTTEGSVQKNSSTSTVSEIKKSLQGIVQLYEGIIIDYPNSDLAAQSLYRIGIIRVSRFFDFNGALEAFRQVKKTARTQELACDASLRIGELFITMNNLASARTEYQGLLQTRLPLYQQRAQFSIAELDYFEGRFDSTLAKLMPLAANFNADISNDVLLMQYFIAENRTSNPAALMEFAKADLLMRERRYSESLARFNETVRQFPTSLLVDDATMKIGELQLLLNQPNDAIVTFHHLVNDMPESILRDHAHMRIAEVFQFVLKDKAKAIQAYEQILAKFPNSLYLEEARKRIRQLRGDSI